MASLLLRLSREKGRRADSQSQVEQKLGQLASIMKQSKDDEADLSREIESTYQSYIVKQKNGTVSICLRVNRRQKQLHEPFHQARNKKVSGR